MLADRARRGGSFFCAALAARRKSRARRLKAGAEAAQVAVHRLAVFADRGLELLRLYRQAVAAGNRAEHVRIDDRTALLRESIHVDEQSVFRKIPDDLDQSVLVEKPVGHGNLLIHRVEAAAG